MRFQVILVCLLLTLMKCSSGDNDAVSSPTNSSAYSSSKTLVAHESNAPLTTNEDDDKKKEHGHKSTSQPDRKLLKVELSFKSMQVMTYASDNEDTNEGDRDIPRHVQTNNKITFHDPPSFAKHEKLRLGKGAWVIIFSGQAAAVAYRLREKDDQENILGNCELLRRETVANAHGVYCNHNTTTDRYRQCDLDKEQQELDQYKESALNLNPEWKEFSELQEANPNCLVTDEINEDARKKSALGQIPAMKPLNYQMESFAGTIHVDEHFVEKSIVKRSFSGQMIQSLLNSDNELVRFFGRKLEWCTRRMFCRALLKGIDKLMRPLSKKKLEELTNVSPIVQFTYDTGGVAKHFNHEIDLACE